MVEDIMEVFSEMSVNALLPAILTFLVCLVVMKVIMALVNRLLENSKRIDLTLQGFISSAVRIVLWLLTAIIVADMLGVPTTSLVALVSVVGLALSLSIQNIMSNLFSGITLLISKPFVAGDYVDISGKLGTVKSIGLFYTVIATSDNMVINIPNADVTAASLINYSSEPLRRVDMIFSASYEDKTEAVKAAILEAIAQDERIKTEPEPFIALKEYKSSSIDYVVRLWCENADYWSVYFGMNERVRESFEKNGVTMTYEHVNVHIVEK